MNYLLANRIIFIGKPIYDTVRARGRSARGSLLSFLNARFSAAPAPCQVAQYVCSSLLALELQNPNEDIMVREPEMGCGVIQVS